MVDNDFILELSLMSTINNKVLVKPGSSYHTAGYVDGTKFKQLFHSGGQFPVSHRSEVVEGEQVRILR